MSGTVSANKLWFFRPLFANGDDLSEEGIKKQYLALDPKPSALKTASPSIFAGTGAFVVGVLSFLFGKNSPLLHYSGLVLGIIGAGLALAGQFIFKIDLSSSTGSNEPKPLPKANSPLDNAANPYLQKKVPLDDIISSLDNLLKTDKFSTFIRFALHALGKINDPKAKQKLVDFLLSSNDLNKGDAANALIDKARNQNETGVYKLLGDFVKDKNHNSHSREDVILVLIDNYSKEDVLVILNEIKEDDPTYAFVSERISEYSK